MSRQEKKPAGEKITDPVAQADRRSRGPFLPLTDKDEWGRYAPHYTTVTRFGQVDGVRWYNNCGPTAVTNLLVMARRRFQAAGEDPARDLSLYAEAARYGARRLIYLNARKGPFHGTSDLRAGAYIRQMCRRALGMSPHLRFLPVSESNLRRSLDCGALVYLLLRRHPAYGNHHLIGYGYTVVQSQSTGETRFYLKVSDGHAAGPRYLDLSDSPARFRFYYEVRFPVS